MSRTQWIRRGWGGLIVASSGVLLAGSCSSTEVKQAVMAGVEVAANQLLTSSPQDDISFGDWLSSELND